MENPFSGYMAGKKTGLRGTRQLESGKYVAFVHTTAAYRILGEFDTLAEASAVSEAEQERLFAPLGLYLPPDLVGRPPVVKEPKERKPPTPRPEPTPKIKLDKKKKYVRRQLGEATNALVSSANSLLRDGDNNNTGILVSELRARIRERRPDLLHNFARLLWAAKAHGYLEKVGEDTTRVRYITEKEGAERAKENGEP